jgi:hypothetical protein
VQHQDSLLLAWLVALVVDDQGRRHQELFLEAFMGVHPERATKRQGKS